MKVIQSGFHNAKHAEKEQQYFSLALDNLSLVDFSDKYVITQLIASKKHWNIPKKITATIARLIQYGTSNMGQATQTLQEKSETRRKKYISKLDPKGYCWSHGEKFIHSHT